MVRSYERHEPTAAFSLVCSNTANGILGADGKTAYLPALEDVLVWDMKLGALQHTWHELGFRLGVTALARAPHPQEHRFAVGYADGSIRLWDERTATALLTFHGHQRAVTTLAFDAAGVQLASGSQDTSVIVWDTVAESGLFRYATLLTQTQEPPRRDHRRPVPRRRRRPDGACAVPAEHCARRPAQAVGPASAALRRDHRVWRRAAL